MKKSTIITLISILSITFFGTSYALWGQNAEVSFRLTISEPEHFDFDCPGCTYDTVQEGFDLHRFVQYPAAYNMMASYKDRLQDRVAELNSLPFGGITAQELSQEVNRYRDELGRFGDMINAFGTCIRRLADFYNSLPWEERSQIPDFWEKHDLLWSLSNNLWSKRSELYDAVNAVEAAGQAKID